MTRPSDVTSDELDELRARASAGELLDPERIHAPELARVVALARVGGSPLLPALDACAEALADRADIADTVRVATAQAKAVAMGLLVLPAVLVPALGAMLDLDLLGFYRSPAGLVVAALAGGLLTLGATAIRVLLRRAARLAQAPSGQDTTDDETIDLLATVTAGATVPGHACRLVAASVPTHRSVLERCALALQFDHAVDVPAPFDRVLRTLSRAGRLGAPSAPALRRLAAAVRNERRTRALESAQRLPALLTFPTALCLLPASILLVGAPLIASGLGSLAAGR